MTSETNGAAKTHSPKSNGRRVCAPPQFDRLCYFYGQLLGAKDFKTEQAYFREKSKLHNRCLHGYGVVCGLEVKSKGPAGPPAEPRVPPTEQDDCSEDLRRCRRELEDLKAKARSLRENAAGKASSEEAQKEAEAALEEALKQIGRKEHECECHEREQPAPVGSGSCLSLDFLRDTARDDPFTDVRADR